MPGRYPGSTSQMVMSESNHWSDSGALSTLLQILYFCSHSARCGRDNGNVLSLCGDGPWDLELWSKLPHDGVPRRNMNNCMNELAPHM